LRDGTRDEEKFEKWRVACTLSYIFDGGDPTKVSEQGKLGASQGYERLDELEDRINALEDTSQLEALNDRLNELEGQNHSLSLVYGMGMMLAMILSWSRNASILYCILHGLFSWLYVIYFAWTRR